MERATKLTTSTAWPYLAVVLIAFVGCGDSGSTSQPTPVVTTTVPSVGAADPALAGTWAGQIAGSSGNTQASGDFTMLLNGDGSMTASSTNASFRPVNGSWGVSQNQFTARGTDTNGTAVNFTAPRSTSELTGTFTAGSGGGGTFTVTKQ